MIQWVRLVTKLKTLDIASLSRVSIPDDKPESWDAADAFEAGLDIQTFLENQTQAIPLGNVNQESMVIPSETAGELVTDTTPTPQDLIGPRILTPGGLLVFGGAPKVGKTSL